MAFQILNKNLENFVFSFYSGMQPTIARPSAQVNRDHRLTHVTSSGNLRPPSELKTLPVITDRKLRSTAWPEAALGAGESDNR